MKTVVNTIGTIFGLSIALAHLVIKRRLMG